MRERVGYCRAAPKPKVTYSQEYRRLTTEFQRRRHAQAFAMLEQMLKKYKAPAQTQELRLLKAENLGKTGKHPEALKELASLRDAFKEDKTLQAQSLLLSAASLRGLKRFPEAVATYQKVAKDFAAQPDRAAEALVRAAPDQARANARVREPRPRDQTSSACRTGSCACYRASRPGACARSGRCRPR